MEVDLNAKEINTTDALKKYKNARVLWPPDCPDDILDIIIAKAGRLLSEFDIDVKGVVIAEKLKKYMDDHYGSSWHVICGRHFGCYSIYESGRFVFFYLDNVAFLLYKSS